VAELFDGSKMNQRHACAAGSYEAIQWRELKLNARRLPCSGRVSGLRQKAPRVNDHGLRVRQWHTFYQFKIRGMNGFNTAEKEVLYFTTEKKSFKSK
jgi:hypothetical protein